MKGVNLVFSFLLAFELVPYEIVIQQLPYTLGMPVKGVNLVILKVFIVDTSLPTSKLTTRNDFAGCFVQHKREKETK